ncbi:MAG: M28 family metallopeptidase [Wenzhouxiangellaceae bacterium]|nr:M28 family metallopeptidase [Wenzhouxiangellaceae bacterium]
MRIQIPAVSFNWLLAGLFVLAGCSNDEAASPEASGSVTAPVAETETVAENMVIPPLPPGGFGIERYVEDLETLASDRFEGRAPGSRGERLTVNHLVQRFAAAGLEPGYGESYLQPVPMVELTNQQRSSIGVAHDGGAFELTYPEQMIIGSRRLGTDPHGVSDSELVFVGYGVVAPEYDWNDYAGLDVEGKTVVILVNDPGFASPESGRFNGRAMTYYGRWTYKYEEAARQGAAAALIVHETEPASYPWEVVTNSWSGAQFELAERGDEPIMALEGWITVDTAVELFERAGLDYQALKARAGEPGFDALSLEARMTASVRNAVREGLSYNVLARLPGSERPDETVVYMAHWDHLGRNLSLPGSDGIFNGAIDNASGTAGLLELARMHAEAGPSERSLLFLAVTLEEYGLLGSKHYVNNPVVGPEKTVAAINMDAVNFMAGPTRDMVVVGIGSSELEPILEATLAESGRSMVSEPTPEAGYYYRSDHFNFARGGIPALYAKSGFEHVEHGTEYVLEIEREYRDNRYHKPGDVFDPDWDFNGIAQDVSVMYRVGRYLSDSADWPNWLEGNEFRAIRDRQRP